MCLNRRALAGLVAASVVLFVLAGRRGVAFLPLLLTLACPLSMGAMMLGMRGKTTKPAGLEPASSITEPEVVRLRAEVAELRRDSATAPANTAPTSLDL